MGVPVWWPSRAEPPVVAEGPAPARAGTRSTRVDRADATSPSLPPPAPPSPSPAPTQGLRPAGVDGMDWSQLQAAVEGCQACGLCRSRRNTVFGVGDAGARWMVIGEAPGEREDLQGEPFVGAAGHLLDNMLRAVGVSRQGSGEAGAYVANVLKCRPPANRNPQPEEVVRCEPFLQRQVALVRPRLILAMGRFAVQSLLRTTDPIGRLRGRIHTYEGVPVVVTYHPAYLLRNLPDKAKAWADLCLAREQFDRRS
jgi:uracil-DNA glycosylase